MKVIIILFGILAVSIIALIMIEPKNNYSEYTLACYGSENGYYLGNDSWVCNTNTYSKWGHQVIDTYSYDGILHKFSLTEILK